MEDDSLEDEQVGLEEDNLILGVVKFESSSKDEVQLIWRTLQDMSSFAHRTGSGPASQPGSMPPIPQLRDKTTPEQSPKPRENRPTRSRQQNVRVRDLSSILTERDLEGICTCFFIHLEYKTRVPPAGMRANTGFQHRCGGETPSFKEEESCERYRLSSPDPLSVSAFITPTARPANQKTTEPRKKNKRQRGGDNEPYSSVSEKGLKLWTSMRRKYGKDASASSDQVALAIAAQCALPNDLARLESMEDELFLDQIDSMFLCVRELPELVATLIEDLKVEHVTSRPGKAILRGQVEQSSWLASRMAS
ncbi:hypothetical protein JCGZ_08998 [Jatropha curcas]|uniref:Uncharacterized protein n=1 Tax=Jatropha curcas TaxID=180498 RepID=A0A067KTF3_JATCU|nr:hypothetical protein JCGZ_08998 [Jatropha curcas]